MIRQKLQCALCHQSKSTYRSYLDACWNESRGGERKQIPSCTLVSCFLQECPCIVEILFNQNRERCCVCECKLTKDRRRMEEGRKVKISSSDQQEDIDWPQSKKTRNELSPLLLHRTNISDLKKKGKRLVFNLADRVSTHFRSAIKRETWGKG